MAFKGFGKGVQDQLNSYYFPQHIRDQFFRALTPLVDRTPSEIDYDNKGLFYRFSFEDRENPDHVYRFFLSIARNDTDFWVFDIAGYAVDGDGEQIWSSDITI